MISENTNYFKNLSKEQLKIYKEGLLSGSINPFDQVTLSKLKRIYCGFYTGLIYMYLDETTEDNLSNKIDLLLKVFEDKDITLVHASITSVKSSSWVEVNDGKVVYVYDPLSLMMFEKEVYYKMEKPTKIKTRTKNEIFEYLNREGHEDDFKLSGEIMLTAFLPIIEKNLEHHPYKDILSTEISRFKEEVGYDNLINEWSEIKSDSKI